MAIGFAHFRPEQGVIDPALRLVHVEFGRHLNAALAGLARDTLAGFRAAIATSGIDAPLYLTLNDGTVMSADMALALPVISFASGATNSMRGAAFLSGIQDAMVVDVGGTSTDIGQLRHGFPREANSVVEIGEVRTLIRMPDLFSLALRPRPRQFQRVVDLAQVQHLPLHHAPAADPRVLSVVALVVTPEGMPLAYEVLRHRGHLRQPGLLTEPEPKAVPAKSALSVAFSICVEGTICGSEVVTRPCRNDSDALTARSGQRCSKTRHNGHPLEALTIVSI